MRAYPRRGRAVRRSARRSRRRRGWRRSGGAASGQSRRRRVPVAPAAGAVAASPASAVRSSGRSRRRGTGRGGRPPGLPTLLQWSQVGRPGGAAPVALQHSGDLLAEGPPRTARHRTDRAPRLHRYHHPSAVHRYVRHRAPVEATHPRGRRPAHRARHRLLLGPGRQTDHLALVHHILDDQYRQPRKHRDHKGVGVSHAMSTTPVTFRHHRSRDRAVHPPHRTDPLEDAIPPGRERPGSVSRIR